MPICLTQSISNGQDHPHTAPPSPLRRTLRPRGLFLGKLNIRNCRGYRLTQAIQVLQIGGFNLMILTEIKITDQSYCFSSLGYNAVCFLISMTSSDDA